MKNHNLPNISYTLSHSLCTGCGICECTCPSHAIHMVVRKGRFIPQVDENLCKNSKGCHRCHDACAGLGIDLLNCAENLYDVEEIQYHKFVGRYLKCYIGYSEDALLREKAASGGMVSQFLIWLLENHKIDGVAVTRFNKDAPLKVESFIATTKEDILSAKGSKYSPVSLHEAVKAIKKAEGNRYVVVGLPCHIQGLRKLMNIDKRLSEKITGLFSLFCSGSQTFHYTEYILKQCGGNVAALDYLAYREGFPSGMVAKGKNFDLFREYKKYNMPLKATFYPRRCLLCTDMFGELADINFGDIHVDNPQEAGVGISGIIVRNSKWQDELSEAFNTGALNLKEISLEQILHKRAMAKVKKSRNASFIVMLRKLGVTVPVYDSDYEGKANIKVAFRYLIMRSKQFVGNHRILWFLLPKIR